MCIYKSYFIWKPWPRSTAQENLNYLSIIYEDDGISGAKASRPALDRMMEDVKSGKIEKVLVYSFSRYARSTSHLLKALETFKELDVAFVSITENLDTNTPLGVAIFSIISSIAQLERDLIESVL